MKKTKFLVKQKQYQLLLFYYSLYFCLGLNKRKFLKEEKEEKNSSSIVHHQSVKGIHGSVKKYTGRYCEHCFAEFQGKSATTYLIRHIHSSHQNVFRNLQKQYLPIAIKIASPVVQRGLDEMKSQTTGLQDYEIILNPRLAEILKLSGFNSVSSLPTQKKT
jgi:hypothetical protein